MKGTMVMKQCEKGHIFDEKMYSECPYCNKSGTTGTRPLDNGGFTAPEFPKTSPLGGSDSPDFPATRPLNAPESAPARPKKEMSVTVALNVTDTGINPVRGWLVVTAGDKMGLPFVIHGEKNVVGRGSQFDINLAFDKAVSKEGDAVIAYDSRTRKFFITLAGGKNNIYHNDSILLAPTELKDYDTLEIGSTKFVFRSLCNEEYTY